MSSSRPLLRPVVLAALVAALAPPAAYAARVPCRVIGLVDEDGRELISRIQATAPSLQWVELDRELLACGDEPWLSAASDGRPVLRELGPVDPRDLVLVQGFRRGHEPGVLASGGRFAVVEGDWPRIGIPTGHGHSVAGPVPWGSVLARQVPAGPRPRSSATSGLVDAIDPDRWFADVTTLAGWNRYTHGSGIGNARDWLVAQFEALPTVTVTTQAFTVGSTTAHNVVAVRAGTVRPNDWYIVGGHYDSTSESPGSAAPGAEDNASGCAGVLEMARVLTAQPPAATLIFICYSGEEQGLHGSAHHASGLVAAGEDDQIRAMLNMDMIGYTGDADLDCLLETEVQSEFLLGVFATAAAQVTTLRIVTSLFAFGSDHVPYLDRGMPALLTIENDWSSYPHYHRTTDLPGEVDLDMGYQILRMNVAALAEMTGLGSTIFADGFESGNLDNWLVVIEP